MDTENFPTIETITDTIRFWVSFATSPGTALAPYEGLGDLSIQLLLTLGAGLAVSMFIVYILGRMGWSEVPGITRDTFGPIISRITGSNLPPYALLPAVVLFIFAATVVLHLFAVSWVWVDQRIHLLNSNLGGTVLDSFNAAVGFLAFFIPLATVAAIIAGSVSRASPQRKKLTGEIVGTGLGIVFVIYYPLALTAVHPDTTYFQALSALFGWPVSIILLAMVYGLIRRVTR